MDKMDKKKKPNLVYYAFLAGDSNRDYKPSRVTTNAYVWVDNDGLVSVPSALRLRADSNKQPNYRQTFSLNHEELRLDSMVMAEIDELFGLLENDQYDGKIVGRVVLNGRPVSNAVVRIKYLSSLGEEEFIVSDSLGNFEIPIENYKDVDAIRISVASHQNYDQEYCENNGLISWIHVESVPTVPSVLPDLELNGFGFKLLRPATDSRVDGYPYQVLINEYDRNVDIRYRVYFYDNDDNYLGYSKESFTGSNFNFNGVLSDDSILDSANTVWYASAISSKMVIRYR